MAARAAKTVTTTALVPIRYENKTYKVGEEIVLANETYEDLARNGYVEETKPVTEESEGE